MSSLHLLLSDIDQTQRLGALLAEFVQPGDRLLLLGEMGAGKTTLARAIGVGLAAEPPLTSPTFVLLSEHAGRMPIWHVDAYRLPEGSDPLGQGLLDERQSAGLTILEWPDRMDWSIGGDQSQMMIRLTTAAADDQREVEIDWSDDERLLALKAALRSAGLEPRGV